MSSSSTALLTLGDFVQDAAHHLPVPARPEPTGVTGVRLTPLAAHGDARGALTELLSTREGAIEPLVHVYRVTAAAGSVRAWVYHRIQTDRLAFTEGAFEIAVYDIRPESPTRGVLETHRLGAERPALLEIAPWVVHGVRNAGDRTASFVNLPTAVFDPAAPDKYRLPFDDPRIPYRFA